MSESFEKHHFANQQTQERDSKNKRRSLFLKKKLIKLEIKNF